MNLEVSINPKSMKISAIAIKNDFEYQIVEVTSRDPYVERLKELMTIGKALGFQFSNKGLPKFQGRVYVPGLGNLREDIMNEAHKSRCTIHPGTTKKYQDLKRKFWWSGMKRDIAKYVSKCLTCQKIKIEQQNLERL